MKRHKIAQNQDGISLLEVVMSFLILATIMSLFLANYRSANNKANLIGASQKLVADLRLAQSYALGSKKINGVVPVGWGINSSRLNPNNKQYILYADLDGDYRLTNSDAAVATTSLPSTVFISQNTINGGATQEINIIFSPPDPTTWVRPKTPASTQATSTAIAEVYLQDSSGQIKSVKVNFFGLIEVGM